MSKKAFIVGINTQGLKFSENDAHKMSECLKSHGYEISQVETEKGKYEILKELGNFIANTDEVDTLIFYFSGHGVIINGQLWLVVGNTNNPVDDEIDIASIISLFDRCVVRNKLIILDCCNATGIKQNWNPRESDSYRILAASKELEIGKELEELEGSFLTYYICQALTEYNFQIADENGKIFVDNLFKWLIDKAKEHNQKEKERSKQVPLPSLLGNVQYNIEIATIKNRDNFPFKDSQQLREAYLRWLIEQHNRLELRGVRKTEDSPTVPLEKVYVALKGDRTTAQERIEANKSLNRQSQEFFIQIEYVTSDNQEEFEYHRRLFLIQYPNMPSHEERSLETPSITLGEAFQKERWLVILGDPGSGKTTLARWLTVKLAQAMLNGDSEVNVPLAQVDPQVKESDEKISLGLPRLPVLVRVSDYAEAYRKKQQMLVEYLGYHPWLGLFPTNGGEKLSPENLNKLIKNYLKQGKAVIILDGMDEITASNQRLEIVSKIDEFIKDWIDIKDPLKSQHIQVVLSINNEAIPLKIGGNQIIITSRIAGYHQSPIKSNVTQVIIEPMRRVAVEYFCDTWTRAVYSSKSNVNSENLEKEATEEAEALKAAIYDPNRPRIRQLASNPLLVTILSIVFHRDKALPEQRADLYDLAMKIFMEDWRKTGLTAEELILILSPLAAYIHQNYPTGLIESKELKAIIKKYLDELPKFKSKSQLMIDEKVDEFITIVEEDVGLLAARGQKIYGFLHLTFQEYLAALYLIRSKDTAAQEIISRLDNPRWREPILLALGHISSQWVPGECEKLLQALLDADDPLGDLLPRTSLFMAAAMEEMGNISEQIVQEVARRLLFAYSDRDKLSQFKKLSKQIENAFTNLWAVKRELIEKVLCEALRNPPKSRPDVAPAAATLIYKNNWFTDKITQALLDALPNDSEKWDWAINNCIQEIISPNIKLKEPTEPTEPTDEEWQELKEADFAKYQQLKTNFAVAQAAYKEQKTKYEELTQRQQIKLPNNKLRFKTALQKNPQLVEYIKSNPMWLRLVIALYGGYYDYKAPETWREYRELILFIRKPENIQQQEIARNREYYIGKFGAENPTLNIIAYLDPTNRENDQKIIWAKKAPEFNVEAIYRDSSLTNVLLSALRQGQTLDFVIDKLWIIWKKNANDPVMQVDALIALAALGEDIISELENALNSATQQEIASSVLKKFSQLRTLLQDSITRAIHTEIDLPKPVTDPNQQNKRISKRYQLILALDKLSSQLNDLQWNDVVATLANVMLTYSNKPLDYTTWEENLSQTQKAYISAEYWVIRFLGGALEEYGLIYNAKVALNKIANSPPGLIINSLSQIHQTQNLNWDSYTSEWLVEDLSPRFRDSSDVPLEVIRAVENIRIEKLSLDFFDTVISEFLKAITPLVKQNTDLLPEILTLNLLNTRDSNTILQSLTPQLKQSSHLPNEILEMAYKVKNPYYCSRALLRLGRYYPLQGESLLRESLEVAGKISDSHQKCRVLEYILPYINIQEQSNILKEILSAAQTISDPDDKARALARLSKYLPQEKQEKLLREAIQTASLITDEYQKAETLSLLYPYLTSEPDLVSEYLRIAKSITDSWSKSKALRLRSPQLLQIHEQLQQATEGDIDLWTPIVLGAIVNDVINHFENISGVDGLWSNLALDTAKVEKLYEVGIEKGLTLTRIAATTLDELLNNGNLEIVYQLLPLLQDPTPDAIPVIERWLKDWNFDQFIVNHVALILSEKGRHLTPQTIDSILALVGSEVDRSRIRASLVLSGGITNVKREQRFFRASELGEEVMNALGQVINDYEEEFPFIAYAAVLTQYDIIHDDPSLIEKWAQIVNTNAYNANAAEKNLKEISELTRRGWEGFRRAFETGNNRVRKAMMYSLCWLVLPENKQNYTEDPSSWLQALSIEGMEEIRALRIYELVPKKSDSHSEYTSRKITPCPIIESASKALQQKRENPDINLIEAAEKALEEYTISAATALLEEVGNIKYELGEIVLSTTLPLGTGGSLFRNASEKYAVIIDNEPEIFQLLVDWLAKTLAISVCNEEYYYKLTVLLADVAVYAELSPATFINLAYEYKLEPLLAETVKKHDSVAGRVAAIKLIGYLDKISIETVIALQQALIDEQAVEQAAIETFTRIRQIEGDMLDQLVKQLDHDSAKVAYTSAQILSLLGRSDKTKPEQRKRILKELADAVRLPSSKRGIYQMIGTGSGSNSFFRLSYQGKLNQAFFQALLEVSGVL